MSIEGRPLRAGIIGCGEIAQEGHIPGLLAGEVEIGAVCDANVARAQEVGERFGVASVHMLSLSPGVAAAGRSRPETG